MEENIFEAAGKIAKAKKDKQQVDIQSKKKLDKNDDSANLNVQDMMQKMKDMRNDLEGQMSEIYKKGSEININVDHLMEASGALAVKNLDKMKDKEKILTDKIDKAITPESCLKKNPKSKDALTQERKGKLRGSRHNWIPVR